MTQKSKADLLNEIDRLELRIATLASEKDATGAEGAARWQVLVDEAPVSIATVGLDKRFLTCNAAFCSFLGYSEEELKQKTISEVTHPDDVAIGMADLGAIVAGKRKSSRVEKRYVRKDGTVVWGEVSINLVRNQQGQPLYFMPYILDMTEHQHAAETLRENELKYRALFETVEGAILLFTDGRWVDCNAGAARLFGCTREQIIGAHPSRFSPPTQPDGRSSEVEAVKLITLAFTIGPLSFEWEHCRADGSTFAAEVNLNRVDLGGTPHIQAIVRDVSERKQAEKVLQAEKANLEAIFESSPVAMFILDETTNIVMTNHAFTAMCGGSEADILQHRPGNALRCVHSHKDPRGCGYGAECKFCNVRNGVEGLIANGGSLHGAELELELTRNEEPKKYWMNIGVEPVVLNGRKHWCIAMDDVTERKRTEVRLALNSQRMQSLLQLNQMREATLQETTDYALEEAVRLTQSTIGYLAFLNDDESVLTMHAWSKSAMAECAIIDKPIIYPVVTTGLWGEAVRQRRPVFTNDYTAANPLKKGYPEGHVAVKRHMNIPVFAGSRIVLVAGVGNKAEDYNQDDVEQLTLLMEGMWRLIERKRMGEVLEKSEERYRKAQEMGHIGDWGFDPISNEFNGSPEANRIYGFPDNAVIPLEEIVDCVSEKEVERVLQALFDLIKDGTEFNEVFEIHPRNSSETRVLHSVARMQEDEHGNPMLVSGILQDITEQKRAEEALRESENKYKNLIGNIPGIIFTIDLEGKITFISQSIKELLGYESAEMINMNVLNLIPEEDRQRAMENLLKGIKGEKIKHFQIPMIKKSGERLFFECSFSRVYKGGALVGVQGTAVDITERKQAEEELRRHRENLEVMVAERTTQLSVANKELEAFSYSVSHDLRAPLRGIDGFSHALLEEYGDKLDDTGKTYLERVCKATQKMGFLIDDMLKLSRITQAEMKHEAVDLSHMVREITETHQKDNPDRAVDMTVQEGIMVQGDPYLLKIAMENLVGNAFKFTGMEAHPRIEFGTAVRDGETACFIRDNGAGFDMAYVDKLFGAFQRLHDFDEFPGTGIGLATVRRIINRHGGRVWAEGDVGKGATFYVTLPL